MLPTVNNSTWTGQRELTVSETQATVACGRREEAARAATNEESVWELNCQSGDQFPSPHDHFHPAPRTGLPHNLRPRSRDRGGALSAGREDGTSRGYDVTPAARGFGTGSIPTSSSYRDTHARTHTHTRTHVPDTCITILRWKEPTHRGVHYRSKDVTQTQHQRPVSPTVTLTWHAV